VVLIRKGTLSRAKKWYLHCSEIKEYHGEQDKNIAKMHLGYICGVHLCIRTRSNIYINLLQEVPVLRPGVRLRSMPVSQHLVVKILENKLYSNIKIKVYLYK
jgi:hypothetical protein